MSAITARPRGRSLRGSGVGLLLVLAIGASFVPFVWVLLSAFKSEDEIFGGAFGLPGGWDVTNFEKVWSGGGFAQAFANSLLIAVSATLITVAVSAPAGYVFGKLTSTESRTGKLFYVYLLIMTLPGEAIMVPTFYQLRAMDLVDTRTGLVLVLVAAGIPLGVFLTRNYFRDLPGELLESARIDGAGEWTVFWRVMLPLAKPAVLAVAVFTFLGAWNEYQLSLLLLTGEDTRTIPLALKTFQSENASDFGALFAGITLAVIPSILVYVLLQRSFMRGIVAGSLK